MVKVLHILDHSLPNQDGYATRSHSILCALADFGLQVRALTGPKQEGQSINLERIDGIEYHRVILPNGQGTTGIDGQVRTIMSIRRAVRRLFDEYKPELVHVHSPSLNGLAVLGLGLPFVYEMRSSWEDAAVSVGVTREGSIRYRISRALETQVARLANSIVVICEGLKNDLVARGISASKIHVVPNALSESFFDIDHDIDGSSVRRKHGLTDAKVIAFFGSFFEWEGIVELVQSMPAIIDELADARLLIAGGGRQEKLLHSLVETYGLQEKVIFAGRVPAAKIPEYYAAADVMVFPRRSDRLTEMVTPLKPLEAMAMETIVIASDVGGHLELIDNGVSGLLYKAGDEKALVDAVISVLTDAIDTSEIIKNAKQMVTSQRRWKKVAEKYLDIYTGVARHLPARRVSK